MTKANEKIIDCGLHYSCNSCTAWVSEAEAIIGEENIGHFCNEECLKKWCEMQRKQEEEKKVV